MGYMISGCECGKPFFINEQNLRIKLGQPGQNSKGKKIKPSVAFGHALNEHTQTIEHKVAKAKAATERYEAAQAALAEAARAAEQVEGGGDEPMEDSEVSRLRVASRKRGGVLRAACCVLCAACCVLRAACRLPLAPCCLLLATPLTTDH
jgi:hypothetical protein